MNKTLLLLFALLLTACEQPLILSDQAIIFENARIINPETGMISDSMSILVDNKMVVDVFKVGSKEFQKVQSVNINGNYAIPGLWDMHVHFRGSDEKLALANRRLLPLFTANGITTVRDAGGDISNQVVYFHAGAIYGYFTGPKIYYSGPKIDGKDARWAGSLEVETKKEVEMAVDSLKRLSVHYVKIYDSTLSGKLFLDIVKETEKRGMLVTGHLPFSALLDEAIDAGLDGIEHLYYVLKGASDKEAEVTAQVEAGTLNFWDALRILNDAYNPEKAKALFEKMAANNVYVTPTLYINQVLDNLHSNDHSTDEYLEYLFPGMEETYQGRLNAALNSSEGQRKLRSDLFERFMSMIPEMHAAGVKILAGSDAGAYNSYVYPGISLHKELELLQEAGLPAKDVLKIATMNGPEFFNKLSSYGPIEKGKIADFVFLRSNPLESISNTQDIAAVVNMGRYINPSSIQNIFTLLKNKTLPDF